MFEKKFMENTLRKGYERKENEKVYQILKREATQLSRLRHPSLLEVVEAVEESRTVITFATEPILASLSNLLGNCDNLSPVPDDIKNFEMDELEVGYKGTPKERYIPEAIFVNIKGDWKIGGFGFSNFINPDAPVPYEYPDYDARIPCYAQKNYDYMAPEYVLDETLEVANDMFALGCLIYTRMTATEFQTSKYFDNILVSTVKFFESFPEKSKDDKANFMKGLIRILPQFPERVLLRKEIKDHSLLPYTLPNIFFIAQKLSPLDFTEKVLIPLKPVFAIPEPMQNMIACLDKIELFKQKTSLSSFKEDVMPLIYNALETKSPAIQDKVLRVIPTIIDNLDLLTIKSSLFPRIQNLFVHTTILSVKVTTLVCLHSLVKSLDNVFMQITALSVYDEMGKNVEKDVIATEILPQLWKMSVVPTLNMDQFQKFMQAIKQMSMKVEEEHSKQLRDIKTIDENVTKHLEGGNEKNGDGPGSQVDFEKLVGVSKGSMNNTGYHANGKKDSVEVDDLFDAPHENSFTNSRGATPPMTPQRNSLSLSLNSFSNNKSNSPVQPFSNITSSPQPAISDGQLFNRSSTILNSQPKNSIPSLPPPKNMNQFTGSQVTARSSTIPQDLFNSIPSPTASNRPHSFAQSGTFGLTNSMSTTSQSSIPMGAFNNLHTSVQTLNYMPPQPKMTNFNNHVNPMTTMNFNSASQQPQITPSLNHSSILQPNTRSNMPINNNSGSHKKPQADLTMFDPYS
ncbi:2351_t:CDS:10 [Acaulospora colombiana]|uniref:2351_t:CDS:1 n=1 Tax=Acaulospora colombiana TaxID=27376 RepID=A0ACA9KNU0_9GLOM|nr:2351_t:CDS:10 [Acaulospora colombiana]